MMVEGDVCRLMVDGQLYKDRVVLENNFGFGSAAA